MEASHDGMRVRAREKNYDTTLNILWNRKRKCFATKNINYIYLKSAHSFVWIDNIKLKTTIKCYLWGANAVRIMSSGDERDMEEDDDEESCLPEYPELFASSGRYYRMLLQHNYITDLSTKSSVSGILVFSFYFISNCVDLFVRLISMK